MRGRRTVFLISLGLAACGRHETFVERAAGAPLMLGAFESYATEETVRSKLGALPIDTLERSGLPDGDRRPPYTIVTLGTEQYRHLEHTGKLRLTFFNDRLMDATFYPRDVPAYKSALKSHGIDVRERTTGIRKGMIRIWIGRDYRGQDFVTWADARLEDQSGRWIGRYS